MADTYSRVQNAQGVTGAVSSMATCPDCKVEMEETEHETSYKGDGISIGANGGILGALDVEGFYLTCFVCPDCGLARFYADI